MNNVLYMAWRYLRFHWGKSVTLVASISLILAIPAGLQVVVEQGGEMLTARAASTPLLIGAKGSAVDLTLSALYFRPPRLERIPYFEVSSFNEKGVNSVIPLHLRFSVGRYRFVGTTVDYFEFRGLTLAEGRGIARLGECVLGSRVAAALGVGVGGYVLSSSGSAFDVAGSFPLKMPVVGILAPHGTADDDAVFGDVKTAWIIEGLAHGHRDITQVNPDDGGVLRREEDNVVANSSVLSYVEITDENIDSFHFHGDPASFPIDAAIVVPRDLKEGILLRGRYQESDRQVQLLVPSEIIDELLATMFSIRDYVVLASGGVGLAALATAILVFVLSIRLRRREIETIRRIGGARQRLNAILAAEILLVLVAGTLFAVCSTLLLNRSAGVLIRLVAG